MASAARRLCAIAIALLFASAASTAWAQAQTKTTETKAFEVVSVDGNKLVLKGAEGSKEFTVPPDFRFTVDGRQVPVSDLKPGMKGTATITTTVTTTPVTVTEVKNGEVMQASGSSVIVKTATGIKMFSEGDLQKRNVKIMKDGQPVELSSLHAGDHLSATIITEHPPKVMTERQVQATLTGAAATAAGAVGSAATKAGAATAKAGAAVGGAAADAARAATGATAGATGGAAKSGTRTLPKTASPVPLIGLVGLLLLAAGATLTLARRRT